MDEITALQRRLARERAARQEAERLLEEKSLQLYESHQALLRRNAELQNANAQLEATHLQLLQSEKLASVGQLAAGVAHEINNPVGFVLSNLNTLKRYLEDMLQVIQAYQGVVEAPDPQRATAIRQLDQAKQAADWEFLCEDLPAMLIESSDGLERVRVIVQDLKDFSRAGTHATWLEADLEHELERTLKVCWNALKYKATIVREYGQIGLVECIPSQINQVFLNLLTNAGHALGDAGTIWLRSGTEGPEALWLEVEDSGCGIPPENLGKIFDPFFTTKPVGTGTGLGLSLSYGIIATHLGRIEVFSPPGQGARFRITLPRHRAAEAASGSAPGNT